MARTQRVFRNLYRDSVSLMQLSAKLGALAGMRQASAIMATPGNLALLREAGLAQGEVEAGANDLLIVAGMPAGRTEVELHYRASRWPLVLSCAGWIAIAGIAAAALLRRAFAPAREPARDNREPQVVQGWGFMG